MWLKGGKERRMGWREDGMERGWDGERMGED